MVEENLIKNTKKKGIILIVLGVIILIGAIWLWQINSSPVKVITEKKEYQKEEALRIKIENNLENRVCLSSCYPYYVQVKEDSEASLYKYGPCPVEDKISTCIEPKSVVAREIKFPEDHPYLEPGKTYRLIIPACIGCIEGESFIEKTFFQSNQFKVK